MSFKLCEGLPSKTDQTGSTAVVVQDAPLPNLPFELLFDILLRLGKKDVYFTSLACKRFSQTISDPHLWRALFRRDYPIRVPFAMQTAPTLPWKDHYRMASKLHSNLVHGISTIATVCKHPARITCMGGKGDLLFTGSSDGAIKISRKDSSGKLREIQTLNQCGDGTFRISPLQDHLLHKSLHDLKICRSLENGTFNAVQTLNGDGSKITDFNWSEDHLFMITENLTLKIWRKDSAETYQELPALNGCLLALIQGDFFFAYSDEGDTLIYKKDSSGAFKYHQKLSNPTPDEIQGYSLSYEDGIFCIASTDGTLQIARKAENDLFSEPQTVIAGNIMNMICEFVAKGDYLFAGLHLGEIKVFKKEGTGTFKEIQTLIGHQERINAICLDETYLLTGSTDGTAKIWEKDELGAYKLLQTLHEPAFQNGVTGVKIDGDHFLTSYSDGSVRLWDFT
ncbi:MAG: F-box-like domain-containing protein [Verrucomicrobia bacterium]|nr:F-box-like domain-containing protein [Verrucomicrobiota bacterium]